MSNNFTAYIFLNCLSQNLYVKTETRVKHKSIRLDIPPEQVIRPEQRNRWQHSRHYSTFTGDKYTLMIIEFEHLLLLIFLPTLIGKPNKCIQLFLSENIQIF